MQFYDLVSILVTLVNLFFGFFVWWKGKRKKVNIYFFLLTLAVAGWVFTNWISIVSQNYSEVLLTGRLTFSFAAAIAVVLVNFVILFSKANLTKIVIVILNLLGLFFIFLSGATDLIVRGVFLESRYHSVDRGLLFHVFDIFFIIYIIFSFVILFRQLRAADQIMKLKLKYVIYSFLIASIIGVFANLIWPEFIYFINKNGINNFDLESLPSAYGPLFSIIMILGISYSIIRYRLMDIRVIIRRGLIQLLTFIFLFSVYAYAVIFLQRDLFRIFYSSNQVTIIFAFFLIIVTIEPLRRIIYKFIDRLFTSRERVQMESLKRVELISKSTLQFKLLVEKVKDELKNMFSGQVGFLLINRHKGVFEYYFDENVEISILDPLSQYFLMGHILITEELTYRIENGEESLREVLKSARQKRVALALPLGSGDELVGVYVFFEEDKPKIFTSDKIEFLKSLSNRTTLAFAGALAYKQAMDRMKK